MLGLRFASLHWSTYYEIIHSKIMRAYIHYIYWEYRDIIKCWNIFPCFTYDHQLYYKNFYVSVFVERVRISQGHSDITLKYEPFMFLETLISTLNQPPRQRFLLPRFGSQTNPNASNCARRAFADFSLLRCAPLTLTSFSLWPNGNPHSCSDFCLFGKRY